MLWFNTMFGCFFWSLSKSSGLLAFKQLSLSLLGSLINITDMILQFNKHFPQNLLLPPHGAVAHDIHHTVLETILTFKNLRPKASGSINQFINSLNT